MTNKLINLKLTAEKNCFLSIPRSWRDDIQQKTWFYFELININNSTKIYLEWSGNCVSSDEYVELSATFANKLGFIDNQMVLINIIEKEINKANEIIIQPNSEFDWQNFKIYSNEIESNLLNQIKLVWSNLVVPIWPKPEICIYLKIHFKDPNQHLLRLETFTELIGVIDEREIKQLQNNHTIEESKKTDKQQQIDQQSTTESTLASFFKFLPTIRSNQTTNTSIESTSEIYILPTLSKIKSNQILNIINGNLIFKNTDHLNKINTIFVNCDQFEAKNNDKSIGKLVRLLSPNEISLRKEMLNKKGNDKIKNDLDDEDQYLETIVEINFIDQCPINSLIASNTLVLQLDLRPFSKVVLKAINNQTLKISNQQLDNLNQRINDNNLNYCCLINIPIANKISFSIYQNIPNLEQISSSITSFIKDYCILNKFLILTKSTLFKFNNYEFTFQPEFNQNDYVILTEQSVQNNLEIRILNQLKTRLKTSWNIELPRIHLDQIFKSKQISLLNFKSNLMIFRFKNYQLILDECLQMINQCFQNNNQSKINLIKNRILLIHGKKGAGKTMLINDLINELNLKQEMCNTINLDCAKLKGKKIDLFKKSLLNNLNESIYTQPCLLIIENLHILLPKSKNIEQEHKLDLLYNQKVKLVLIDLIERYLKNSTFVYGSKLVTIITSRSCDLFENQNLELDMFDEILELKAPSSNCCIQLINYLIKQKLKNYTLNLDDDQIDFNYLEQIFKTELTDCLPLDLNVISDKVINNSILDNLNNQTNQNLIFKTDHYLDVFNNYIPFNLRSIKSKKNKFENKTLNDLGGLNEVKERLKQIILWPIKYPKLFTNYPIEPQTCVLLYGMPGTGKTCIAKALANEFKINFISIKGPEILSKYIGASEQAVRELFDKANLSKPCILFFDEFDSIVPPRQNNNTDVTDRIVNQILTQMDGIESLQEGIYIIAATSRPDMIDPALLRPGRFDVCLECNLPNLDERLEILNLLSKQIQLDESVDLKEIAKQTINYTGSDLNTLIINANNHAINELISLDDELNIKNSNEIEQRLSNLKLNKSHFDLALKSTSPSFSVKEIQEYNRIFSKLKSDNSFDKQDINLEVKSIFAS